jgi:hypothetical protein
MLVVFQTTGILSMKKTLSRKLSLAFCLSVCGLPAQIHPLQELIEAARTHSPRLKDLLAAGTPVPAPTETIKHSKDEWKKLLDPQAYNVLREEGTERIFPFDILPRVVRASEKVIEAVRATECDLAHGTPGV